MAKGVGDQPGTRGDLGFGSSPHVERTAESQIQVTGIVESSIQ
ncbi:MAG: hypothetical protein ACREUM_00015 [Nitrosospira sp.]